MKQAVQPARKRTKKVAPPPSILRADIQGLRAFAVIVVILDHLAGWPTGGFVGVDIFLVISGFLITGHLMREWEKTGRISFVNFYKRRIKRILPAATLVIIVTVAVSFALFARNRAWSIFWDGLWATFFAGNWRFASAQTDYFQADGPVSPLQHFWSLGVEEQFYFVWPWLMLGALAVMSRFKALHPHPRVTAGAVIFTLTAASFAWAMNETTASPTMAYFSTLSRAWELGVGALLALVAPTCGRISNAWRPVLAWTAVVGMVASIFIISPDSAFPGPWAALPVAASALFIMAGTGGAQRFLGPFTNPVSGYIGDLSYSLYLWHFPAIIFLSALIPEPTPSYYVTAVFAMLFLAAASYHLVEDPIRSSGWLIGPKKPLKQRWAYADRWLACLAGFTILILMLTTVTQTSATNLQVSQATPKGFEEAEVPNKPSYSPEVTQLQTNISTAISMTKWPELSPGEDSRGADNWMQDMRRDYCFDVQESNMSDCYFSTPGAKKTVVLLGDSHAIAWAPGLRKAMSESGYNMQMLTMQQCPAASVEATTTDGSAYSECTEHRKWALDYISNTNPELVILSNASSSITRLASSAPEGKAIREVADGMRETINAIKSHANNIVVLSSPPAGASLDECQTRASNPADCQTTIASLWKDFVKNEKEVTVENDAVYVDSRRWFCATNDVCPVFVGNKLVRIDTHHLSIEYSTSLSDVMKSEILERIK